jgi:NAD(P)H dehydrogenase (quinone)
MTTLAVTGASGAVGGRVARRLAALGHGQRLVVRDPGRAPDLPGASVVQASYSEPEALRRAFDGVDVLLLVSAAEAVDRLDQRRTAVAAARDAGVGRVVYTSFLGASPTAAFTLARDHAATEQALTGADLRWTGLRNSLYADVLPEFATDGVLRGPAGDGRVSAVGRDDIADVAVALLLGAGPDGPLDVTGPEALTLEEVAGVLTRLTGRPYRYERETVEQAWASRSVYGAADWQVEAWVSTYTAIAGGELAAVSDTVDRLAGHPATPLEQVVRRLG